MHEFELIKNYFSKINPKKRNKTSFFLEKKHKIKIEIETLGTLINSVE